jgi:hypothetical protein
LSYYNAGAPALSSSLSPSVPTGYYHNPYSAYAANHAWQNVPTTNNGKTATDAVVPNHQQPGR